MRKTAFEYLYDRASLSEKQQEQWYVDAANQIIKYAISLPVNDKDSVSKDLRLSTGDVPIQFILESLRPFIPPEERGQLEANHNLYMIENGNETQNQGKLPDYLVNVDFMNQIRDRYLGEYIRQYSDFQVYNRNTEIVMQMNKELDTYLSNLIQEMMMKIIDKSASEEELEKIDLDKKRKDFIKDWIDEKTIEYQHKLNLLNDLTKSDIKYAQAFLYWFATENVVTYRTVKNGKFIKEIVNPLDYYRIPNNTSPFIKDDVCGVRVSKYNMKEIIGAFQDKLSSTDLDYIKQIISNHKGGIGYEVSLQLLSNRNIDESILSSKTHRYFTQTDTVNVYHIVLHSIKPIKVLTYVDIDGIIRQKEVDKDYIMDVEIGDKDLYSMDTFETIEFYRIGEEFTGVYTKPELVEHQTGVLPYNGIVGFLGLLYTNPIPRRIAGLLSLYKFYTLQQQMEVAKYKNFMIVPESLVSDSEEMTREEKLEYAKKDNILYINDEDTTANSLQALRSLINQGVERYIDTLTQLRESTRREAMDVAAMNEQRYGETNPNMGKAVTEYAITRATTASIPMFSTFNFMREEDAMLDLLYGHQLWKDGYKGSYFDRSINKPVYVDFKPENNPANIGVFIKNNVIEQEKRQRLFEIAFNLSQGGEYDIAVEAIDSEGISEIKKLIKDKIKYKEQIGKDIQQYQEMMKIKAEEIISQREQENRVHESTLLSIREEASNIRNVIDNETALLIQLMKINEGKDMSEINEKKRLLESRKLELDNLNTAIKVYTDKIKNNQRAKATS